MDKEFLEKLDEHRDREIYARIIALTFQETPVELIEGTVTGGSINIDGSSALRRTCSLSLVADKLDIDNFYWGIKSKFRLEIGLKNTVDINRYPEIIWFPQGTFVINSFNTARTAKSYTISISGKDKMCLLNGNLGGNLTASIDFGVEEYYDKLTNTTTYTKIPIEKIIREALHAYALEPYHNIVINDLDEAAVELLEYRGDTPLYLLRNVETDEFVNYTDNGGMIIEFDGKSCTLDSLEENDGWYDKRVELAPEAQAIKATEIVFKDDKNNTTYTVAKIEYGQTVGYRNSKLVYAGDLISNVGETLTSILDKITKMLGNYEYFYDIDGRFIFQRKKTYVYNAWEGLTNTGDEEYENNAAQTSAIVYRFEDNTLITSFQNAPNLANLKNDYSIWGERESASGATIPIHYRYAIDYKPKKYTTLNITEDDIKDYNDTYGNISPLKTQESKTYTSDEYDWRELIYQMALDYFQYNQLDCYSIRLAEANKGDGEEDPLYQHGTTGYEQYYTDLQGFWRQLYNSNPEPEYLTFYLSGDEDSFKYTNHNNEIKPLFVKGMYLPAKKEEHLISELYTIMKIEDSFELQKFLDAIDIEEYLNLGYYTEITQSTDIGPDFESQLFYVKTGKDEQDNDIYTKVRWSVKQQYSKEDLYVYENEQYILLTDSSYAAPLYNSLYYFDNNNIYYNILELEDSNLQVLYYNNNEYNRYLKRTPLDISGAPIKDEENNYALPIKNTIYYYTEEYDYIVDEESEQRYWTLDLINNPAALNFWFDFLDAESELGQFAVPAVGDRTKAVNDNNVRAIYFRQVPNLIFTTYEEYNNSDIKDKTGYIPVFITSNLEGLFNISAQGKSAQEKLDELLYQHAYRVENVTIQAIPIYYLQPNTRIFVKDEETKIDGEYIVSKITIPLQYNGLMTITASKAPERLY